MDDGSPLALPDSLLSRSLFSAEFHARDHRQFMENQCGTAAAAAACLGRS